MRLRPGLRPDPWGAHDAPPDSWSAGDEIPLADSTPLGASTLAPEVGSAPVHIISAYATGCADVCVCVDFTTYARPIFRRS